MKTQSSALMDDVSFLVVGLVLLTVIYSTDKSCEVKQTSHHSTPFVTPNDFRKPLPSEAHQESTGSSPPETPDEL
jgi:hypothetical protein